MKDAPKEIWISPTNYRWWTSPCEDLPLLHRYIHAAESKEAADRIEQLEAENAPDVLKGDPEMTELELMANEEARHGNREALERLEREAQLQAQEIDKTRRRADEWQNMVLDCEEYLKPGETPRQRMDRDHADVLALMKLLETEKRRVDRLKSAIDMVDRYSQSAHVAHDMKIGIFPERSTVSEYLSEIIRAKIQENDG